MSDQYHDLSAALTRVAREVSAGPELDQTLGLLVAGARAAFPEIDHAGISIAHRDGSVETRAATDDLVRELDELQYALGEGPCLYAIRHDPVVKVNFARTDDRWPSFLAPASDRGLRSQLGLRLYTEEQTIGGLNLYSTTHDVISPEVEQMAQLYAAHATLALGRALHEQQLSTAIASRQLIGQATGIVMERYQMNESRAFEYLLRVSSLSNVKLRDIARELVDKADSSAPARDNGQR